MLARCIEWLKGLFSSKADRLDKRDVAAKPPVRFSQITIVARSPRNADIQPNTFYLVAPSNKLKWAMFLCPCGCGHVITLSLQRVHNPHWRLDKKTEVRPTLYPSVWQKTPCYSHFWLRDGRIYWCEGTGSPSPYW